MEYKPYLCEYRYNGAVWSLEIYAASREEAAARLAAIGGGRVLGVVKVRVKVPVGPIARLLRFLRKRSKSATVADLTGSTDLD